MKLIDPTPEQTAVIEATESSLVVLAAAGAGKTGTLVQRYLRHVREGMHPDEILTITFTRKAAAEMKERIVESLMHQGLRLEAQIAETGPIQTIHGFCERLLRENSIAAGIDPEFDVLGEGETSRMIDDCIRRAIAEPTGDSPEAETLISRLAGQSEYGFTAPHARLEEAVRRTLNTFRGSGSDFRELATIYGTPSGIRFYWQSQLLDALPREVRDALNEIPSGENVFERIRQAYKACGIKMPRWISTKIDPKVDQEAAEDACGLMHIVCSAWAVLEQQMERMQALDFSALESRAVKLLHESQTCRTRIKKQYRMVMVDEAQDVNPVQYRLLDALDLETEMIVGDPQQSIYGFRQADVRLFRERALATETKRLSKNWRSTPGILEFVDTLFGRIWTEYTPMREVKVVDFDAPSSVDFSGVELWSQREEDSSVVAGFIKDLRDEGESLRSITVLVRGLRYGVLLQKHLQLLGIASRIAGGSERFYTRLEIRDLANVLVALTNPYDDFALLATLRSPFCGLSIDSIALLSRQLPVVNALSTFVAPIPEDAEKIARFRGWFEKISKYADRLPAWEVLAELFAVTGYPEALAKRRNADQLLANVRKLLALASQEPELGPAEFARRIREIQNLKHREGDAPAEDDQADLVTIMTVHKAKGLEFDVVVVPETLQSIEPKRQTLEIDPARNILVPRFGKLVSAYHAWISDGRRARERAEEERVLYVALTRAKRRLCVVAHPRAKKVDCFARVVAKNIGMEGELAPGLRVRGSDDEDRDE